ncbi:MAG: DUF2911 domain-containing protein [Acidobacteriota bacterium]|jgi:hypothetical protein
MTRTAGTLVTLAAALAATGPAVASFVPPRVSPQASVSQTVGTTQITIAYSRPSVKGRAIWGELVPYDQVWRTGANEATTFTVTDDVTVNGSPLPAGTYSLATIPGKAEWTVIFNKDRELWGMYQYKPENDALRIKVKPAEAPFTETLEFTFPTITDDSATVVMRWEKLAIPFTVKVDVVATTLARARAAVAAAPADDWRTPMTAANWLLSTELPKGEAMKWLDRSIAIQETSQNLGAKARALAAGGDTAQAIALARRAIELAKAANPNANTSALENLITQWQGKK